MPKATEPVRHLSRIPVVPGFFGLPYSIPLAKTTQKYAKNNDIEVILACPSKPTTNRIDKAEGCKLSSKNIGLLSILLDIAKLRVL